MNETYVECLVAHKKNTLFSVLKYLLYGLAILCAIVGFLGALPLFILAIVLGVAGYYVAPLADVEYEYLYLDKEISIDKVIAKQRRKRAMGVELSKVEIIAPSNSHALDSYRNRTHTDKDFSSGYEEAKTYTMVYLDKEQVVLIKFEPNAELLKAIKMVFPRKISEV